MITYLLIIGKDCFLYIHFYIILFSPNNINHLFPNKHPSIHPRLLWIISSNSNNPLQSQSWLISIADDTVIPTSNPIHHFSFLPVNPGNKIPAGKSSRIFNRFSCNKPPSAVLPNLPHLPIPSISFHDQNTSSWYCLSPGVLVKTVEPNTIARNVRSSSPQTAWPLFYAVLIILPPEMQQSGKPLQMQ